MAGTLLIVGLTLFLLGSVGLARNAGERGHSWLLLLVPFASARYVHHYWSDVWLAALMRVLGVAVILAAGGVTIARDPLVLEDPVRLFGVEQTASIAGSKRADMNSFVNSSEAIKIAIENDENEKLSGRIHGEQFIYDRVEVIDGLFTARQGSGFLPELEMRILLDGNYEGLEQRQTLYVQPGDDSPPPVHLSWKDEAGKLQTEIIRSGYRMELQLAPLTRHQLSGFLQIILPDINRSFLSGEFIAYTNRLRYIGDRVDLTFDHRDTLKYVAEQYLQTQYPEGAIESIRFRDTDMKLSKATGNTTATITLANGRVEERVIPLDRSDIGWAVNPSSVEITVLSDGNGQSGSRKSKTYEASEEGTADEEKSPRMTRRTVAFPALSDFVGKQILTRRLNGKEQRGILREVSDKRIQVEASLGSGTVQYRVERDQLAEVEVPAQQLILTLEGVSEANDARIETPEEPEAAQPVSGDPEPQKEPAAGEQPAPQESTADLTKRLSSLEGRQVTIENQAGKRRSGLLKSVSPERVTLTVPMGAGEVDYYYKPSEIRSINAAGE